MTRGGDPSVRFTWGSRYRLAWLFMAAGAVGACTLLWMAGLTVTVVPLLAYASLLSMLLAAHLAYRIWRPDERIALVTGALSLMIGSALFAGIIANAGLRLRFPYIDDSLAGWDRLGGMNTPAIVMWTAKHAALSWILGLAYSSIFPLAFITAIWLGIRTESARLWELVLGFSASIQIAAVISVVAPALGNIVYAGLHHLAGHGLPGGAGIYHLHAIADYRDGAGTVLDLRKLEGVVTFPSFHMIMAIIVPFALRRTGVVGYVMAGWGLLVAISTVPIGGHYVIDLIAGLLLWLGLIVFTRDVRPDHRGVWAIPTLSPVRIS